MKLLHYTCIIFAAFSSLALAQTGGSLTPPIGAPSPTYKTLDQVEARAPLVEGAVGVSIDANDTITISEAGSYYLTGNVDITGNFDGIRITTSGVTLDLNGFQISGTGTTFNSEGIFVEDPVSSSLDNIKITNGSIQGFWNSIEFSHVSNSVINEVRCINSLGTGIYLSSTFGECNNNIISKCLISNSLGSGIYLLGNDTGVNGNTISECSIYNSQSYGIYMTYTDGNTVINNTIRNFSGTGIRFAGGISNRVESNHVSSSSPQSAGIRTLFSTNNLIIKNSVTGQIDNYSISSNDTYGPEVSLSGALSSTGDSAHPWANFSLNENP
ncbi:MAG: right-handed parallel beta-helix repeat-containing protein [Akkermansiaceae bacterium]